MTTSEATPETLQTLVEEAAAGDTIVLSPGKYPKLHMAWIKGERGRPIVITAQPGAVFDGGRRYEDFQLLANRIARETQQNGGFPGVYPVAHNGHVVLRNCRHIRLEGAAFRGCWPTGVAIRDCVDIGLIHLDMEEGSFAIFAEGSGTENLLVEGCTWVQDVDRNRIWQTIPWKKIHGNKKQPVKDDDARAFDGDFFRSFGIRGNVTIRNCKIEHAFNGVHMYHSDSEGRRADENRDVRIYRNRFDYIRDNAIEPERGAINWWVFHNDIFNCHKWFSVDGRRLAFTYFFANTGWFDEKPTVQHDDNAGAVWKTPKKPKNAGGLNYVFNNSFYLRSKYIKKRRLRDLRHFNNAVQYCDPAAHPNGACDLPVGFFGDADAADEEGRFTKQWRTLNIRFFNDMVSHPEFPERLIEAGYAIENGMAMAPGFVAPAAGNFRLTKNAPARGKGAEAQEIELADGGIWQLPGGLDLGAWQGEQRLTPPDVAFGPLGQV